MIAGSLKRPLKLLLLGLIVASCVGAGGTVAYMRGLFGNPWAGFEKSTLNPGFSSRATPGDLGLPYRQITIVSGGRKLDGFFVPAGPDCGTRTAVLIFHGRNETIADWVGAQQHLHAACIASLAFDYSGHGHSDGPGTIANLDADGVAAYQTFVALTPNSRRCILSHSMGGGPMLQAAMASGVSPNCIVLASPFSSLRSMAMRDGLPAVLAGLMPDVWDNVAAVRGIHAPLLWIHSKADRTIPIAEGQAVFDAAPAPKTAQVIDAFDHNAIHEQFPAEIWGPMTTFLRGE